MHEQKAINNKEGDPINKNAKRNAVCVLQPLEMKIHYWQYCYAFLSQSQTKEGQSKHACLSLEKCTMTLTMEDCCSFYA